MKDFKIYTDNKERGSGGGRHGSKSGLHYGEWFSVALMRYNNLDYYVTQIYFDKAEYIDDGIVLEIKGNETENLQTDEDCLKAVCFHNPNIVYKMMEVMRKTGVRQGKRELREDFKKLLNI